MTDHRIGPLAGYRPNGSPRNGFPESATRGYRYNGTRRDAGDAAPADPRHPGASAREARRAAERSRYEARVAEFARLMAEDPGRTQAEAAVLMGLSAATVKGYARELRERASAGGAP